MDINRLYTYETIKSNLNTVLDTSLELRTQQGEQEKNKIKSILDIVLSSFIDKDVIYSNITEDIISKLILVIGYDGTVKLVLNLDLNYTNDLKDMFRGYLEELMFRRGYNPDDVILLIRKEDLTRVNMDEIESYRMVYDQNAITRLNKYTNIDFLKDNYYSFMSEFNLNLSVKDDIRNKLILMMDMFKTNEILDNISSIHVTRRGLLNFIACNTNYIYEPIIDIIIITIDPDFILEDDIHDYISNVDFPNSIINISIVEREDFNANIRRNEVKLSDNDILKIF